MARTNRLVDRICQIYDGDESIWNIPINQFYGACVGILGGYLTSAAVIAYLQFSAQEETDWNALVARVIAYSNTGNTNPRDRAVEWIRTILNWYEDGSIDAFNTPDKVWSWLMAI